MKSQKKLIEPIPDEFESYEKAAEFWDTHDTTDYLKESKPVKIVSELRSRHYEIEIDLNVAKALRQQAKQKKTTPSNLANELLKQQLVSHK